MACHIAPEKFLDLIKTLLRIDASKYASFDNAVKFVLSGKEQGLSQENQMLAIAHMAHIYQELALSSPRYDRGQAAAVLSLEPLTDSASDYLREIDGLYPQEDVLDPAEPLTLAHVQPALDAISEAVGRNQAVAASDVSYALQKLDEYLRPIQDLEAREQAAQPVYEALDILLTALANPPALRRALEEHQQMLAAHRSFIAWQEIAALAGLDTYLGVTTTGERIELTKNPRFGAEGETEFLYDESPVTAEELVGTPVRSNPIGQGLENTGQNVFLAEELSSALVARALNPAEQDALDEELALEGINLNSRLKVVAMPLEAFTNERLARLHELAETDPQYAGLLRREHETFENEAQIRRLKEGEQQVLTVRRPTASEDGFALIGETPAGKKFVLYSPRQYTVVSSDNSTRGLDLTQPADLELAGKLSVVRVPYGPRTLDVTPDTTHLSQLQQSTELYNKFETQVLERVSDAPVDVTDLFQQHYLFARETPVQTLVPMDEFIQRKGEEVAITVNTVRLVEGLPVENSTQEKQLPVIFSRYGEQDFRPINPLEPGEFIWHENNPYTYEQYVRQVVGIDHQALISKFLSDAQYKNVWSLLVYFSKKGGNKFMLVEPRRVLSHVSDLATFFTSWEEQRTDPGKNRNAGAESWLDFGQKGYGFKLRNHGLTLNFNAERKAGPGQGQFTLELRASNVAASTLAARVQDWRINFQLDPNKVAGLYKQLFNASLLRNIRQAFPGLATARYDDAKLAKSPALLREFYEQVTTLLGKDRESDLAQLLQQTATQIEAAFGDLLKEDVTDKLVETVLRTAREKNADSATIKQIEQDLKAAFTNEAGEDTSFLLATEYVPGEQEGERTYVPTVQYAKNRPGVRRIDQYQAVTALPRAQGVQIRPASRQGLTKVAKSEPVVREAVPVVAMPVVAPLQAVPAATAQAAADAIADLNMMEDYSIGITNPVSEVEQASQIQLINSLLPQLRVSETDVREFFDLHAYHGHINGAYLNRVIYLNRLLSETGTVYHEAWHGFSRDIVYPHVREELFAHVKSQARYKSRFTEAALREFARQRRQAFNAQTANRVADEILADQLRDFLLGKTAPKGFIRRFFELLQKLFKVGQAYHQAQLDQVFDQIRSGYYASAPLQASTYLSGEVALELIPGILQVVTNPETGTPMKARVQMSVGEQQQLVAKLTRELLLDESSKSFDEKFDAHRKDLYENRFNLDVQTTGFSAGEKQRYVAAYGTLYQNYQYVLGKNADGSPMTVLNQTGDPKFDGAPLSADTNEAVESLRKLVKDSYDSFILKDYFQELAEQDSTKSTSLQVSNDVTLENQEEQDEREEKPDTDFDTNNNEHNRLEGLSTLMRRFFSLIEYQDVDQQTGFTVGRMVDGQQVFNTLMKVTSDAQPQDIIKRVREVITQYKFDGNQAAARSIEAVYEEFKAHVGLDSNDLPTQQHQIYSQFIDAFHGTEMEFLVNTVRMRENKKETDEEETTYTVSSEIKDALIKQDLLQKKLQLNLSLIHI